MSSRNAYLTEPERLAALALPRALKHAEARVMEGERDARAIERLIVEEVCREPHATLDYAELVSPEDFAQVATVARGTVAVAAIRVGLTRLIDNIVLNPPAGGAK
jgi:pantoate--beta-alanine ligase